MDRRTFLGVGFVALAGGKTPSTPARNGTRNGSMQTIPEVEALTFDVFGTVVDWRTSIIREGEMLSEETGLEVDWPSFADAWRGGYGPAMARVRSGELGWTKIDALHRMILDAIAPDFGLDALSEARLAELNLVWHRLIPWPDAVSGLNRLRGSYMLATLSNGNVSLLANMAKNAGLPWDVVLSAELARSYKPDPIVYETAADLLGLPTDRVMMVAAHKSDLRAAKATGMRTAYVARPLEWGPDRELDTTPSSDFDVNVQDFTELAEVLA